LVRDASLRTSPTRGVNTPARKVVRSGEALFEALGLRRNSPLLITATELVTIGQTRRAELGSKSYGPAATLSGIPFPVAHAVAQEQPAE
jgi:hypothetical protein